jgi:adenosylcobyric acid synthase
MTTLRGGLMVCGTTSDAGKSTVVAGLCRLLARQGFSVAPFKGQNMSLNSMVTAEGAEIGRAQWLQAVAAGAEPEAAMNPVLLKPTSEHSSQVVLMGRPLGVQEAAAYQASKGTIVEVVDGALASLRERYDIVVCEGAGSPAEINLLEHDIVNLGLARRAGLPAVLVGDIHRGGVFAHLYGTVAILPDELAGCIRAFIINMFRGDRALLGDAMDQLAARCGRPTLGVLPYLPGLVYDAEDSLQQMLAGLGPSQLVRGDDLLDVAVLRFPRLSNFTDVDPLVMEPDVQVRFIDHPSALGQPDLIVLPGTKATMSDLAWLHESGLADALTRCRAGPRAVMVLGICGGFQMLGGTIADPLGTESTVSEAPGLGWLAADTTFAVEKTTRLRQASADGVAVAGYEIHHGLTAASAGWLPWFDPAGGELARDVLSARSADGLVVGTSLHGLFESDAFRSVFLTQVARAANKPWQPSGRSFAQAREAQIDRVADACETYLDRDALFDLIGAPARPA